MIQIFGIRSEGIYKPEKPVRDEAYKRFIRSFPCIACGTWYRIDPCHTGPHALGNKASDHSCIPLCRKDHDAFDSDPYGFAERHALNIPQIVAMFNRFWEEKQKSRAA